MKKFTHVRPIGTFLLLGVLAALPACDRDPVDEEHGEPESLEVTHVDAEGEPLVATWTIDGGWDGELPSIELDAEEPILVLGFRAFDDEGHEIELSETGEFEIRYDPVDEEQTVLDMDRPDEELFHGDHVHLYGAAPGSTDIRFAVWHGNHSDRDLPAIQVTVVEGGGA